MDEILKRSNKNCLINIVEMNIKNFDIAERIALQIKINRIKAGQNSGSNNVDFVSSLIGNVMNNKACEEIFIQTKVDGVYIYEPMD